MWLQKLWFLCAILIVNTQDYDEEEEYENLEKGDKKLSEDIRLLLDHFKQSDPIGVPQAYVADPYPIPEIKQPLFIGTLYFRNTVVYGISKFRIVYLNVDIRKMEVHAALNIDVLQARGNYTMSPWFGLNTHGPFTINVSGLNVTAKISLTIDLEGQLRTEEVNIDTEFKTINAKFEHLDTVGEAFQGLINSGGSFLFNIIKPYILKEAHIKIRTTINTQLNEIAGDFQFPNSISPLDMVIIDLREHIRNLDHLDPYRVNDMSTEIGLVTFNLYDTLIFGLSSLYRVGNVTLKVENNTVFIDFEIGTQKLRGTTHWTISTIGGLKSDSAGSFSVEYLNARITVSQPLDTRKTPILQELNIEVGNIQLRCESGSTLDYLMEFVINVFPNLLRYQIIDGIEGPLKESIQEELDTLNIEDLIKEQLPKLDAIHSNNGFKLSNLKGPEIKSVIYDDDEFFNF